MRYSLPQGSIIGPHGFILYTSPVGNIMRAFDICFHAYADDLQLYAEFDPRSEGDCERVLARLSSCIDVINEWMIQNTLRLNQDKTEFFVIASRNVSAALSDISLKLGELTIQRSTSIKNLGVTFDDSLTSILKSTLFVNLLIFTYVTFGVYVASSPLRHATTSLEEWSFPVLTRPTLFFWGGGRARGWPYSSITPSEQGCAVGYGLRTRPVLQWLA